MNGEASGPMIGEAVRAHDRRGVPAEPIATRQPLGGPLRGASQGRLADQYKIRITIDQRGVPAERVKRDSDLALISEVSPPSGSSEILILH